MNRQIASVHYKLTDFTEIVAEIMSVQNARYKVMATEYVYKLIRRGSSANCTNNFITVAEIFKFTQNDTRGEAE